MNGEMPCTLSTDEMLNCTSDVPGLPGVTGAAVGVVPPPPPGGTVHAPARATIDPAAATVIAGRQARFRRGARGAFTSSPRSLVSSRVSRTTYAAARVVGRRRRDLEVSGATMSALEVQSAGSAVAAVAT